MTCSWSALNSLLKINEISGNLRKDLKKDVLDSVSTLTSIFANLKNSAEEHSVQISRLESEVNTMKTKLRECRVSNLPESAQPSRGALGKTPEAGVNHHLTSFGGGKKLYFEALTTGIDKRYKLAVTSRSKQSTEIIKTVLRENVNPTEMRVGIKTLKSLKDGRVLIETGSLNEINMLSTKISNKCGVT